MNKSTLTLWPLFWSTMKQVLFIINSQRIINKICRRICGLNTPISYLTKNQTEQIRIIFVNMKDKQTTHNYWHQKIGNKSRKSLNNFSLNRIYTHDPPNLFSFKNHEGNFDFNICIYKYFHMYDIWTYVLQRLQLYRRSADSTKQTTRFETCSYRHYRRASIILFSRPVSNVFIVYVKLAIINYNNFFLVSF